MGSCSSVPVNKTSDIEKRRAELARLRSELTAKKGQKVHLAELIELATQLTQTLNSFKTRKISLENQLKTMEESSTSEPNVVAYKTFVREELAGVCREIGNYTHQVWTVEREISILRESM